MVFQNGLSLSTGQNAEAASVRRRKQGQLMNHTRGALEQRPAVAAHMASLLFSNQTPLSPEVVIFVSLYFQRNSKYLEDL